MIAIGVDPGMADRKPVAIVAIDTDTMRITSVCESHDLTGGMWYKLQVWRASLLGMIEQQHPQVVGIENARGVGGTGYQLQALVTCLAELAGAFTAWPMRVERIHPAHGKAAVGLKPKAKSHQVAERVTMLFENADELPVTRDSDYDSAVSIALAAANKAKEAEYATD